MASQLQAHPYTIPSILYSAEEAGGFSGEDIYEIGQKGLNVLQQEDVRFKNYIIGKNRRNNDAKFSYNISDLFGHKEEIDRESLDKDDTAQIKASISSYLRLLVDYMQFPAALDTVEYLLRMYKIHIYNWEDLVLCSLPYHYKPECHRIVQLVCPIGKFEASLMTCLLFDPHLKVRIASASALATMMDGPSSLFLQVAEYKESTKYGSFMPLSNSLGLILMQLHTGILHLIRRDNHGRLLIQMFRILLLLISSTPYSRMPG